MKEEDPGSSVGMGEAINATKKVTFSERVLHGCWEEVFFCCGKKGAP